MSSLHFKLFSRYATLVFSIILIFIILLYIVWGNTLRTNASSELQADCDNISTLLDTQMDQLNQLSKRIVSSNQVQSLFVQDLYSDNMNVYPNRLAFSSAMFDIIKLSFDNTELSMFDASGRYIHVGMTNTFKQLDPEVLSEIPWFQTTLDAYGKRVILPTRISELKAPEEPVISLCRAFSPEWSQKETAVLELQIKYEFISQKIQDAIHNKKDIKKIYVYDKSGKIVYPYGSSISEPSAKDVLKILEQTDKNQAPIITCTTGKSPALLAYRSSSFTNCTVAVAASEKDLFSSFYQFRTLIIVASIFALLLTLSITYQIAAKLSAPLKKLEQSARSLTLENLEGVELPPANSNIQELDSLCHSFEQMKSNLQNSLQDVVSAHTMAVDAKMLALQAQMNPHFLYNTLASIGVLAEEEENDKIIQMCSDLSLLLRYISSGATMEVTLEQEIEHTRSYIHLIKVKYENRIQFNLNITETLLALKVPKLIMQPLVENCVKYALNVTPPWIISIHGFIENESWMLQIKDNGAGFTNEYLESFYQQTQALDMEKPLPDLSINGMGLLNLYIRLYLRYKNRMIFKLENDNELGACVTVGGPLTNYEGVNRNDRTEN